MEWWRENGAKRLVPALAFDPLDLAHSVNDGCDKLFECLEVYILRQASKNIGEVDARVLVHHFDEHLEEDVPTEFAGFVGQMGCSVRLEQLEGVNDALKEHGQLGARRHPIIRRVVEVFQAHGGQFCGKPFRDIDKALSPNLHTFLKVIISGGGAVEQALLTLEIFDQSPLASFAVLKGFLQRRQL